MSNMALLVAPRCERPVDNLVILTNHWAASPAVVVRVSFAPWVAADGREADMSHCEMGMMRSRIRG
jgi:hypothetical protein